MTNVEGVISVRKAEEGDIAGVLQCLEEAFAPYRNDYTPAAWRDTVLTAETLQDRMQTMRLLVATTGDGAIAGTIGYRMVNPMQGHVRGMAVRPCFHGAEVASRLLAFVESELRDQKCSRISLNTTAPLQRAARFYEKSGFRRSGRTRDFFGMALFEYLKELNN